MSSVQGEEPVAVRSELFEIEYSINEEAQPFDSVQLWYTLDRGASWRAFGFDEDRQSPIAFRAEQEGMHGFFLIATNPVGSSSAPPRAGTEPHLWAFVDHTPPVVQLRPLRQVTILGQRVLQARWTAIDAHFGARPARLEYQRLSENTWHLVSPDPLANTGCYDWRLPEGMSGSVALRLSVVDKGGHRVNSEPQVVEIKAEELRGAAAARSPIVPASSTDSVRTGMISGRSKSAQSRSERMFSEAVAHRKRGEYREGISRLREVVRLNPRWAEPFAEMGEMLYRVGDMVGALNAYQFALREEPAMRRALRGAAMVHRHKNDHASAARLLRTIVRADPNDAEVWVNLGDVAVFQGDEVMARECYTRATQARSSETAVIADARERLKLMAEVSRTYRPSGR